MKKRATNIILKISCYITATSLFFASCATSQVPITIASAVVVVDSTISNHVIQSPVFKQSHTGFVLYDLEKQESLVEVNANKYFIPASNAKLYTLYAGLCMLGDSVPALRYVTHGDSLIFWGTGDPSLLHPDLHLSKVLPFLSNWKGQLFVAGAVSNDINRSLKPKRYGAGWAWDDYNDYYQTEINELPIYGNIVRFKFEDKNLVYSPKIEQSNKTALDHLDKRSHILAPGKIIRDEFDNEFEYEVNITNGETDLEQDVPFVTSEALTVKLLADTLKRSVSIIEYSAENETNIKTLYSLPVDVLYKRMLQLSDNMLAEQIMILCASQMDSSNALLSTQTAIDSVKTRFMTDLPDEPTWVDGSGLSRYNLVTPRTNVKLLQKIYQKIPQQRLFDLLSVGGRSGTLKGSFKGTEPFIFAKSGSFSNTYNISGYLRAKSGKILLFSFMNNNFVKRTSEIRKEVERILIEARNRY
jgi:serine-type D-Ala-D-Ala carboxypeptidase/endopeptidase (penicillin-binding protein 4)